MNNNLIKNITAPNLNDINYADSLNEVFNNINNNFSILANHDFIKGDTGKSVKIKTDKVISYLDKIKECIEEGYNNDTLKTINVTVDNTNEKINLGLYDNITDNSTIHMIYSLDIADDGYSEIETPLSSLYYVFLDGRYSNKWLGKFTPESYNNYIDIEDLSCIIVYENGTFKKLNNAFPTIYYEIGVGLCWKLNGNQTGIPVQGPAGKNGLNANLYIVKGTKVNENKVNITEIFDNIKYISIDEFIKENDELKQNEKYSAIILTDNETNFYFGNIQLQQDTITAFLSSKLPINTNINLNEINNALKGINITKNSTNLQGLFIPIETLDNVQNNEQKTHLMSSTSITNNIGDSNLKTDLILTPVDNINKLVINDDNQINVNKYLYFNINEQEIEKLLKESWIENNYKPLSNKDKFFDENKIENIITTFKAVLSSRNYILKYKLQNVFKLENGSIPEKYATYFGFTDTSNYNAGNNNSYISDLKSMCLLNNDIIKLINKNNNDNNNLINTCFNCEVTEISKGDIPHRFDKDKNVDINSLPENSPKFLPLTGDNIYIAPTRTIDYYNLLKVIPNTFTQSIKNKNEFYRWCLDLSYDEFDPIELKQCSSDDINDKKYDETVDVSTVDDNGNKIYKTVNVKDILILFNSIFTSNVFPNSETEILWFNGFSKDLRKNYDIKITGQWDDNSSNLDPIGVTIEKTLYKDGAVETVFSFTNSEDEPFNAIAISGWNYDNKKLFKFLQFKPTFNNDYKIKEDTAFNINYNVNITGDKNNSYKNLYVNGSVISNDVLSNTLEAKEIKNIYTNDDIVIGGDNSKLIIKPKNVDNAIIESDNKNKITYTTLNSTSVTTQQAELNDIYTKYLSIYNNKEDESYESKIVYTDDNVYVNLQGKDSINIDLLTDKTNTNSIKIFTHNETKDKETKTSADTTDTTDTNINSSLNINLNKLSFKDDKIAFINDEDNKDTDKYFSEKVEKYASELVNKQTPKKYIEYKSRESYNIPEPLKYVKPNNESNEYRALNEYGTIIEYKIPLYKTNSSTKDKTLLYGLTLKKDEQGSTLLAVNKNINYNKTNIFKIDNNSFNNIYSFFAGINAECNRSIWPCLANKYPTSAGSYIKLYLKFYYKTKEKPNEVKLDYEKELTTKNFDIIGKDWKGKDIWGKDINSLDARDRFRQFHFKINDIQLTTDEYIKLLEKIQDEKIEVSDINEELIVRVEYDISMCWYHSKKGLYKAYLTKPMYTTYFNNSNNSDFLFTAGNDIQCEDNFRGIVLGTNDIDYFNKNDGFNYNSGAPFKVFYYLEIINNNDKLYIPEINIDNSGISIFNNYSKNQEIVGIGGMKSINEQGQTTDDHGQTYLFRSYINGTGDSSKGETVSVSIKDLIACVNAYKKDTDAQVGL